MYICACVYIYVCTCVYIYIYICANVPRPPCNMAPGFHGAALKAPQPPAAPGGAVAVVPEEEPDLRLMLAGDLALKEGFRFFWLDIRQV